MNDIERLMKLIPEKSVEMALKSHILASIRAEKIYHTRVQVSIFAFLSLFGVVSIIPSVIYLYYEFVGSSLLEYFSMIITDSDIILAHLNPFIMSIIDSTPLTGVTLILLALTLTMYFYRKLSEKVNTLHNFNFYQLNS